MSSKACWRRDLLWAGGLAAVAAILGLLHHWPLIRLAYRGQLPAYLEQLRETRRARDFQGVKTINLAQAYTLWQQGDALFLDTRSPQEYEELHIPEALNLPPERLADLNSLGLTDKPKDCQMVVYCSQASCDNALKVAERLQALGFTRVFAFLGGFRTWDEAGHPVATKR